MKKFLSRIIVCAVVAFSFPIYQADASGFLENINYEGMEFISVDEDDDGVFDYLSLIQCDSEVVNMVIPSEIDGVPVKEITMYMDSDSSLESVKIPDTVEYVSNQSFVETPLYNNQTGVIYADTWVVGCDETVTEAVIKEGTVGATPSAFSNNTAIESLVVPSTMKYVSANSFNGCSSLKNIDVSDESDYFCDIDGVMYSKDKKRIELYPVGRSETEYKIADGTEVIADYAFYKDLSLESVIIPDGVKYIGFGAFLYSKNLIDFTIPDSVTRICDSAFGNVGIYNFIGDDAHAFVLETVYADNWAVDNAPHDNSIKNGTRGIADQAFFGSSCTEFVVPLSVEHIGEGAFALCSKLEKITINNPYCDIFDREGTISETAVIYGYENSTAQAYAEKYGLEFVPIDEKNSNSIKGDVNYDDLVNLYDAIEIARYIMNMRSFTDDEYTVADYNSDEQVNLYDVIEIARVMMG